MALACTATGNRSAGDAREMNPSAEPELVSSAYWIFPGTDLCEHPLLVIRPDRKWLIVQAVRSRDATFAVVNLETTKWLPVLLGITVVVTWRVSLTRMISAFGIFAISVVDWGLMMAPTVARPQSRHRQILGGHR